MEPFGGPIEMPTMKRLADEGLEVHPVPHDGDLLADQGLASDRPQPHDGGHGLHRRGDDGIPRLERAHPARDRHDRGGARRARLQHLHGASGTASPRTRRTWPRRSGTGPPVVASSGSTASWAGDQPVVPGPGPGPAVRRPAFRPAKTPEWADGWRQVPPVQGPGGPGDLDDRRREAGRAGAAVLHVLLPRREPRPSPPAEGVGGQVQGDVRRGLREDPRDDPGEQKRLGLVPESTDLAPINPLAGLKSVDGKEQPAGTSSGRGTR